MTVKFIICELPPLSVMFYHDVDGLWSCRCNKQNLCVYFESTLFVFVFGFGFGFGVDVFVNTNE